MASHNPNDGSGTPLRLRLASASPRRRELLALTGWRFSSTASDVDESLMIDETPLAAASRLARRKAEGARAEPGEWILAADTIVFHRGRILGKPTSAREAEAMLKDLRGAEHEVITAIVLLDPSTGRRLEDHCSTRVPMRDYSEDEIRAYVASGSPFDKAGGYGIQEPSLQPVRQEELAGCYANVMGLPLCHLVRSARSLGYVPPADVPEACMAHLDYDCPVSESILRGAA